MAGSHQFMSSQVRYHYGSLARAVVSSGVPGVLRQLVVTDGGRWTVDGGRWWGKKGSLILLKLLSDEVHDK